ncbi:MAG: stage IV sporulation protein A [Oscillospiraceae bacterium]|nr:stage IV sporulation protein A [Oscillospiraceae bacterium]
MDNIYERLAVRTGGNIYVGVVGPVRTGKSTMIKRIMEELVIPGIDDPYRKERARDELPQSGSGKTIMTSEPKFIPEEAVEISPGGKARLRVRMIDSVGYMIPGAVGAEEDGVPRMVTTPWYDHEIPMTQAAELGTKKVMDEHCTIGLVVTTDGSITDIPRSDYIEAEKRAILDMKATGKPFLVIVNSRLPGSENAKAVKNEILQQYGVEAAVADCQAMTVEDIAELLRDLLYAFPMQELRVYLPRWVDALENDHPVKSALYEALLQRAQEISALGQAQTTLAQLKDLEQVLDFSIRDIDLATGTVSCALSFPEKLFYEILSTKAGISIQTDAQLLKLLTELSAIKQEYDQISDALSSVKATGYGIVMPTAGEMTLEAPELLRKNGAFGVKLKAGAPSIHMIRVDIDTEISPMVGGEKQSQDLITYLTGEDPDKLWESNIFGKSVYELIREGLTAKVIGMPEDVRSKFRGSLTRIVNEGATGLICLIL